MNRGLSLYWMQCGGCGGDTISFLNAQDPDLCQLFERLEIELLWHPSLANHSAETHDELLQQILSGAKTLDILVVEGAILTGPDNSGRYDLFRGSPRQEWIRKLAQRAAFVVAAGTCASYGGFGVDGAVGAVGLQFKRGRIGGLLGEEFRSRLRAPVINLAGCPCHPEVLSGALIALASGQIPVLDEFQRPMDWYNIMVHQGCTRNEYHEYRVEESTFAERGCLFFHLGCHGPLVPGPCNRILWNQRSSKTRAGVPCFGCTSPNFPQSYPFFQTRNIEGIPNELPNGISRAHYMAYKSMAAAAAPERLEKRITDV